MRCLALCTVIWSVVPVVAQTLPGTDPLTREGDLAAQMVEGIDRFLMKRLADAPQRRDALWKREFSSDRERDAFRETSREELGKLIGVVDRRVPFDVPMLEGNLSRRSLLATAPAYEVHEIRWPVLPGVEAEGLLLQPRRAPRGRIVALPDADWTPEMLTGIDPGVPTESQFARRLVESGFQVVVPVLISRSDEFSGKDGVRFTNQPHREFVYRMAYEMGRHIIGYEVQKVLSAVDWFSKGTPRVPIGVIGYGEGGLVALHAAALDTRIEATLVSGCFQPGENIWQQPIYRNVWSQLETFGNAELAGLVAPRNLIIEASPHPLVAGPPPEREGRRGAASGRLSTPSLAEVRTEFRRAQFIFEQLGVPTNLSLIEGGPGSAAALTILLRQLAPGASLPPLGSLSQADRPPIDGSKRQQRQFWQLVDFTQSLVRQSEFARNRFTSGLDTSSPEKWDSSAEPYRRNFWSEVIGEMPPPSEPLMPETRLIYDTAFSTGYEVFLPAWRDIFTYGILLVPKDIEPGERRPVVVCQHGLEGRPQDLIDPPTDRLERVYGRYAAKLAERGFVVYAPQLPYIGGEKFRILLRKAHPQKLSLYSFIVGQNERTLEWLGQLPFVDANRIGFYGLSYGGKTAMRVPALLKGYALSICSADFNEWIRKITDVDHAFSYMYTQEYDMLEFNLGNTFNYAELAGLIAPRPFMVERGHRDGVGIDEWVAYEYARVRRLYADLGLPGKTEIEYFDGPHQIHGVGTFRFLHRHLSWPEPGQ